MISYNQTKGKLMYKIKVYERQTDELIMESEMLDTATELNSMLASIGSGEGYYCVVSGMTIGKVTFN